MKDEEDIFKIVSDFMKGKSGSPEMEMALLKFEGEIPPELLTPPKMSTTFSEFVEEYPIVASGLSKCSQEHCLAIIGSMLTLPQFHSNTYRLTVLVHMALVCAKGKARPTPAQIVAWFNQLDAGTCGRQEDPAEDVFLTRVTLDGNDYRMFEGSAEGNRSNTQTFLTILDDMPNRGPFHALKSTVLNLLRLSDTIAERAGIPTYCLGNTTPVSAIKKPDKRAWSEMRQRVRFERDQLKNLNIQVESLRPLFMHVEDMQSLSDFTPGHSPCYLNLILPTKDGIVVMLPHLIGTAIRCFIITKCLNAGMGESLHKALANTYSADFSNDGLLGLPAPDLVMVRYDSFYATQLVKEVDAGRYLHLLFFVDGFDDFDSGTFIGFNPVEKISDFTTKSINRVHETFSSKDGFREGLTLIIGCGWGRQLALNHGAEPDGWRSVVMPSYDAKTLSQTNSFKILDLFRALDADKMLRALNIDIFNASGFLNLFAWIKDNNGHIVPHEKLDRNFLEEGDRGCLNIPLNCNLTLRHAAYLATDIMTLRRPDGSVATLRRVHGTPRYGTTELSPFYADIEAMNEHVFRSVYVGESGEYWCEAHTSPELDHQTRFELANMTMHWGEQVFQYFDRHEVTVAGVRVSCSVRFLDTELPDGDGPLPSDEEIRSFVNREKESRGASVSYCVGRGFISVARRPDNLGERSIVRAIVESCFQALSVAPAEQKVNEIIDSIVKTDKARHFHGFSVLQPRDYIRSDLPEKGQTIERMDDASTRLGLGWLCRDRSAASDIEGVSECQSFLKQLVHELVQKFKAHVALFNRKLLIEKLLMNHETLFAEMDTWNRTYGAIEALSTDKSLAANEAIRRIGSFNAATMASRIGIEAAVCESPLEGGLSPGEYDVGQLLASASLIHYMGGYSDAIVAGIMPAVIRISPAGEVMMDHEFSTEIIHPFGEWFQSKALQDAVEGYDKNYIADAKGTADDQAAQSASEHDLKFEQAWQEEYDFSLDATKEIAGAIFQFAITDQKAILSFRVSALTERLKSDTGLSGDVIAAFIRAFSLAPRTRWDAVPEGYMRSSWYPWQFRRQLSLVSRPIIQLDDSDDADLIVAPVMVAMHVAKFVVDAREGALDQNTFKHNGAMFKWVGRINGETGEAFNERVAEEFRDHGWMARANLTDGEILKRKKESYFGDVDVLAWNESQGRVLVIECKDLSFDKTVGEIAKRLANYRGAMKADGRRDDLKKHLDRCNDIDINMDRLAEFVGFDSSEVARVLLFSEATPLQFSKVINQHSVSVHTFSDISDQFSAV